MTQTYYATIDHGQGGDTTITAHTLEEAMVRACDWARAGDWPDEGCEVAVRVWREDEDGDEIESDDTTIEIESAEAKMLAEAETLYEDEDEFSTDRLVRVENDYYLVHANGGKRGAHSVSNDFPATLEPTESLTRRQARAWLLGQGVDPAEVARLTREED